MKSLKGLFTILGLTLLFTASALSQTVLTSLDGTRVDVEAQSGKVVVLAVGASWMGTLSSKQAEITNALAKKYAGRSVVFYFVATDSTSIRSKNYASNDAVKAFALANKLNTTILRDSDGTVVSRNFQVEQVPSFVILKKDGSLAGEPFGGIDPKFDLVGPLSREIDKLL